MKQDYLDNNIELLYQIHHDVDHKCNIAIFKDWALEEDLVLFPEEKTQYDKYITGDQLDDLTRYTSGEDTYFSINSFRHDKKVEKDVWHLNAFALDFDYYKIDEYKDLEPKQFYEDVLKNELTLPPSAVVDSGRGLYVLYIFHHAAKSMIGTYKALYHTFHRKYEKYGMDPNAMKVTQIIRIPGTINSKTGRTVEVLELNNITYQLSDFFFLFGMKREDYKRNKKQRKKKIYTEYSEQQLKASNNFRKRFTMNLFKDFERLIRMRNQDGIDEGYREQLIYQVRKRMQWMNASFEEEMNAAKRINQLFRYPLSDKEVERNCKPYGSHKPTSIENLIIKLEIDSNEQKELKVLIPKKYKDANRNKHKRKHTLLNLTDKEIEVYKRQAKVLELRSQGLSYTAIANELSTSTKTVHKTTVMRDWHSIQRDKWKWKQTMKELYKEFKEYIETNEFIMQTVFRDKVNTYEFMKTCEAILE